MFKRSVSILLPAAALAFSAGAEEPLFSNYLWRAFDTGDFPTFAPYMIAIGDVNDDGVDDAVVSREFFGGPGMSVLMGVGDGTYAEEVVYSLDFSYDTRGIALSDYDSDGDLDVFGTIYGNSGTGFRVVRWRNNGDGTFGSPSFFLTQEGPVGMVTADFTGDGFEDIITANTRANNITLLRHNGQSGAGASFLSGVPTASVDNAERIEASDLDGDGDLDVVVGSAWSVLAVHFNDGSGSFSAPVIYEPLPGASTHSAAVQLADLDNDGDDDLLAAGAHNGSPSYGIVSVRYNDGSGGFGAETSVRLADWSFTPFQIETADLNGDGRLDIVATTPSGRALDGFNVALSSGTSYLPGVFYKSAKQSFDVVAHDADDDGDLDIITVANDSSVIAVHPNLGDGTFPTLPRNDVGSITRDMDGGDIDNDGDLDLVSAGDDDVHVLRNNGDATFPPAQRINTPFPPARIKLRDLNGDGFLDMLLGPNSNYPPYNFGVALNNGNGTFAAVVVIPVGGSQAGDIDAFDLDNDGDLDVVLNDPGPASTVYLFRNNGNGTSFSFVGEVADDDGLPFGVGGGDLDHDGNIDLVFNNALGLTVYLGNGDFTFAGPFPTAEYGYPFVLEDMDQDGNHDLVFKMPESSFGTTELGIMLGFGDGGFTFADITPGPNGREGVFRVTSDVDVGDLNNDGILDAMFTSNAPCDLDVFLGNGDGTVQSQDRYGVGYSASDSVIGDFDGDGRNDVATVHGLAPSGLADTVVIMLGGSGSTGGGSPATLDDFSFAFGTAVGGGAAELAHSDDAYLHGRSQFGFSAQEPNILDLVTGFGSPVQAPATLTFTLESRLNNPGGSAKVRIKNWKSRTYEQIATFPTSQQDLVSVIENIDPAERIRLSDNRVEVSTRISVIATFSAAGFDAFFDHAMLHAME